MRAKERVERSRAVSGLDRKFVDLWRHTKTVCVPLLAVVRAHYSEEVRHNRQQCEPLAGAALPGVVAYIDRRRARYNAGQWHTGRAVAKHMSSTPWHC